MPYLKGVMCHLNKHETLIKTNKMKKRRTLLIYLISTFFVSLCSLNHSSGQQQERLNLKAGFGIPELINAGIRYQLNQFQFGVYIGGYPINDNQLTITGDISYHFAGQSKFTERRPWYLRSGLSLVRNHNDTYIYKDLYLSFKIGRDINLSRKFGLEIDFDTAFLIMDKKAKKEPEKEWNDYDNDSGAGYLLGIGIFYRL